MAADPTAAGATTADLPPDRPPSSPSTRTLLRTGGLAGAGAAAATTLVAVVAVAVDVPLEVDGQAIPVGAFAWWTIVGAALGTLLARLLGARRRFVVVTALATALSLLPAVAAPDHAATKVVLVAAHLLAAAVVVPALARLLPTADDRR